MENQQQMEAFVSVPLLLIPGTAIKVSVNADIFLLAS
jgi:hypothetical protein